MSQKQVKTVNLVVTNHTFIDGELVEAGLILRDQPAEDALSLVGAGKARLAKDEDLAPKQGGKKDKD